MKGLPEDDVREILSFLKLAGQDLESLHEYHPNLCMANLFATSDGLKLQNPFSYRQYITHSSEIVEDKLYQGEVRPGDFVDDGLKIMKYKESIRKNVRQVGLITLYAATLRHDTRLADQNQKIDEGAVRAALNDFKSLYSKTLSDYIENMIQLGYKDTNIPLFSELHGISIG